MLRVYSPLSDEEERVVSGTIKCGIEVHRRLGPGFRERIYETAMCLELDAQGLRFECEKEVQVTYKQWQIGGQRVDLIVAGIVIVEIKAVPRLKVLHQRQVVSYLRATELKVGLLMNFNARTLSDGLKRVVRTQS